MLTARRGAATMIDYSTLAAGLAGLAGAVLLRRRGRNRDDLPNPNPNPAKLRWMVAAGVTVPLSCALAIADATGGTPGKRVLSLAVQDDASGEPPTLQQAVVRSTLKTAIPWELGHQAVWEFRADNTRRGAALAVGAYLALGLQAIAIMRGHRTYADHVAHTTVTDSRRSR